MYNMCVNQNNLAIVHDNVVQKAKSYISKE